MSQINNTISYMSEENVDIFQEEEEVKIASSKLST